MKALRSWRRANLKTATEWAKIYQNCRIIRTTPKPKWRKTGRFSMRKPTPLLVFAVLRKNPKLSWFLTSTKSTWTMCLTTATFKGSHSSPSSRFHQRQRRSTTRAEESARAKFILPPKDSTANFMPIGSTAQSSTSQDKFVKSLLRSLPIPTEQSARTKCCQEPTQRAILPSRKGNSAH